MKTLRSAMEANMSGSVEVSVIRSVQEILNNVTELETIGQRRNSDGDRAIDVVESRKTSIVRNEAKDLLDGPTSGKKEDEQIRAQMVKDKGNMSSLDISTNFV